MKQAGRTMLVSSTPCFTKLILWFFINLRLKQCITTIKKKKNTSEEIHPYFK